MLAQRERKKNADGCRKKTLAEETGHKKRKIGMQTRQHKMENSSQQASCSTAELNSYSSVATDTSSAEYGDTQIQNVWGV